MNYKINLQLVELEDDNYHLVAPAVFGDDHTGYWIVDTGASKTVFDLNLKHLYEQEGEETDQVHTAGIGDKPIQTIIARLHPFSLGKYHVKHLRVALLDLSHINEFYSKAANLSICGLLGGDFLLINKAVIDYRRKILTFRPDF